MTYVGNGSFWDIGGAVAAWCRSDKLPAHSPSQIVSYVSAHDNFTLWDKLMLVRYAHPEYTAADSAALAQNRLAAGIYLEKHICCTATLYFFTVDQQIEVQILNIFIMLYRNKSPNSSR